MRTLTKRGLTSTALYWIARAIAFSENDNDVTIFACHYYSPELAYEGLVAGMKELGDWFRPIRINRQTGE